MARPSPEAIEAASGALAGLVRRYGTDEHRHALTVLVLAAQLPVLVGRVAAAEIIGVASTSRHLENRLPAPLYELPAGKFYDADAIREEAARRAAKDTTGSETVA